MKQYFETVDVTEIISKIFKEQAKKEDEFLMEHLLKNATPKIKEPITAGKLKWRGIRLNIQHDGIGGYRKSIYQRGKQISPEIIYPDKDQYLNSL